MIVDIDKNVAATMAIDSSETNAVVGSSDSSLTNDFLSIYEHLDDVLSS